MPTCRFHGSGGQRGRDIGTMRYMAWIVLGGPQSGGMPAQAVAKLAVATVLEMLWRNGKGSAEQQIKAATWLMDRLGEG